MRAPPEQKKVKGIKREEIEQHDQAKKGNARASEQMTGRTRAGRVSFFAGRQ